MKKLTDKKKTAILVALSALAGAFMEEYAQVIPKLAEFVLSFL